MSNRGSTVYRLASNKSALYQIASLTFSFVLIPTSSDVWLWHLYIRDPGKNEPVGFLRVKWTSVFKGFYISIAYERGFIHERFQPWLPDWENFAVFDRWLLMGGIESHMEVQLYSFDC